MKFRKLIACSTLIFSSFSYASDSDFEKALEAFHQNKIDEAHIHLKNALRDNPNSLPAKLLYAETLIAKRMYLEAEIELTQSLNMGADVNLVVKPLVETLLQLGEYSSILTFFDNHSLSPKSKYHYLLAQANAYMGLEQYDEAQFLFEDIYGRYPNEVDAQLGVISIYLATGQLDLAKEKLDGLKGRAGTNEKVSRFLATLAYEEGDFHNALDYFLAANELEPNNVHSLRGIVNSYTSLQDYENAKIWLNKLNKLRPFDPQSKLLEALILRNLEDSDGANETLSELSDQLSKVDQTFMVSRPQLLLIDAMASFGQKNWEQARNKFQLYIAQAGDSLNIRAIVLLADVYNELNQPRDALQLLSNHESELVKDKTYALILAGTYIKFNKRLEADSLLLQLRERFRKDPEVILMSAHLLNVRGKPRDAIELLTRTDIPQNSDYKHTLAALYMNTGNFEQSLKLSSELVLSDRENPEYRILQAKSQISLGLLRQAEENIRDLYQSNKTVPEVQYEYAKMLFNTGNSEGAKTELQNLVDDYPNNGEYKITLSEVEYSLGRANSAIELLTKLSNDLLFEREAKQKLALIYLQQEQFNKSLDIAHSLLRVERDDADAIYIKARALTGLKQVRLAKVECNKLYALWLEDAPQLLKLSKLQNRLGLEEDAAKSLEQALKIAPNNVQALIAFTKLDIKTNQLKSASARVKRIEQLGGSNFDGVTILKGDLERAKRNFKRAFELYSKAFTANSEDGIAFMSLYSLAGRPELSSKFTQLAENAVKNLPENHFYRTKLADHLMSVKSWDAAKFHYQVLLTKKIPSTELAIAFNNLAVIHIENGDFQQAVQMSQQALSLYDTVPALLDTAGWALVQSGEATAGLSYLRQAYSMNASEPEIIYHLGYTLVELNKVAEAKVMLRKLEDYPVNNEYRVKASSLAEQKGLQ